MARSLVVTLLSVPALAVAFTASAGSTTACTTHECDTNFTNTAPGLGLYLGDIQSISAGVELWESSPIEGTWIDYPGEQTYFFALPTDFEPIGPPSAMVSTDSAPFDADSGGGTSTEAAGQLAEYEGYVNGGFIITNATCAHYYLYVSVLGRVSAPDAGTTSSGADSGTD